MRVHHQSLSLLLLLLWGSSSSGSSSIHPQVRGINSGPSPNPISTTPPNLPGGTIANDAPPGPFLRDFQPPFPTDAWWSGFTVGNQDGVAAGPFPFQTATTPQGLMFGMSDTRRFDGTSIHVSTQRDWTIGILGQSTELANRKATYWDTQVVCLSYTSGAATMDSCLVPGSPYMTFEFTNAQMNLVSNQGDVTLVSLDGGKAKVTHNGGTYLLYTLSGNLQLTQTSTTTLQSQPGFTGVIRMAKLKEASQEEILDQHRGVIPVGVDMSFSVAGDRSTQTWTWRVSTGNANELLMLSWPHHRRVLQNPAYVPIQYLTLKGQMKGVRGNTWVQVHQLPTISWFAPNPPHPSCENELRKTLRAEVEALELEEPFDFYFWGGAFGRASRLALIAEHLGGEGSSEMIQKVVQVLKQSVEYWFNGNRSPSAAYETGWGGFINKDGWNNTWVDFGNAYYNDHHFHYGYLLQGAATIGKYDPAWLNEHREFFIQVARNVGNPSPADPHYTVTRHMDFFAGHSWASGIANGAGPRDQESSGEAINGYYGLLLFAHAINHQELIDYSRMLLAMEIAGAREYWHLYPNSNNPDEPYPEPEFRQLTTVGNVMDTQAGAWLFWGNEKTQIAAIQILPLTPMGEYTYDREWMEGVLPYCMDELMDASIGDQFKSVIYAAYAKVDAQAAHRYSTDLFDWGSGNSASNQLYFVSTQRAQNGGDVCSASAQTPEGLYKIQDIMIGKYVVLESNGQLAATTSADVLGENFILGFTPGGGTIQSSSSGKYVTASPDGKVPLAAARDTAKGYETFRWKEVSPGQYSLTAMVNKLNVTTHPVTGQLYNNANNTGWIQVPWYRLVPADDSSPPIQIPAQGVLRSKQTSRFVVATNADPVLRCTATEQGQGTTWAFERVPASPENAPRYYIRSTLTNQYVTGNQDGTVRLSATAAVPQGWEEFRVVPYQGSNLIVHTVSGKAVRLQADDQSLIDDGSEIGDSALWDLL